MKTTTLKIWTLATAFILSIVSINGYCADQFYITDPTFKVWDSNGDPLSGGQVYFYEVNSTTDKTVYSDAAGSTAYDQPVELDSRGEAQIYGTGSYRIVVYDANDSLIWDFDYVHVSTTTTSFGESIMGAASASAARALLELGTGAVTDVGTSALELVQLDSNAKLPSVDASQLINFTTGQILVLPRSYLSGLALSNNVTYATSRIDIAVGAARSVDDATNILLNSSITKNLSSAWAEGSGSGGLGSGVSLTANTWYHAHVITCGTNADVLFNTKATGMTASDLPGGYTHSRRIGSVKTATDTTDIIAFHQFGDKFLWDTPQLDIDAGGSANITTTETTYTLTKVPTGVSVEAIISAFYDGNSDSGTYFAFYPTTVSPPIRTTTLINTWAQNPDQSTAYLGDGWINADDYAASTVRVQTNTSAQIKGVCNYASNYVAGIVRGWIDRRGRDD